MSIEPVSLEPTELGMILRDMAHGVETGGSLEGNIQFDPNEGDDLGLYSVAGAYRTGNSHGHGSLKIIGTMGLDVTEEIVLYTSDGKEITNVTLPMFRPRMEVLKWRTRVFIWREEHKQYREGTMFETKVNTWTEDN